MPTRTISNQTTLPLLSALGRCNSTHAVLYTSTAPSDASRADHAVTERAAARAFGLRRALESLPLVHLYRCLSGFPLPPRPLMPDGAAHIVWGIEPGAHLGFHRVDGFSGVMSYARSALITQPLSDPYLSWQAGQRLPVEPATRDSIGIWTDNCGSPSRNAVLDALLASGLRVESYGQCRRNMPNGDEMRTDGAAGRNQCRRHRLMVAIENEACPDYVTETLHNVLDNCQAIPVLLTIDGLPKYEQLIGNFPHLNASRPGWLRIAQRIMSNDTFYAEFVRRHQHGATGAGGGGGEDGGGGGGGEDGGGGGGGGGSHASRPSAYARAYSRRALHCQWHDTHAASQPALPTRSFAWDECVYCAGEVPKPQEREREAHFWTPLKPRLSREPCRHREGWGKRGTDKLVSI